MRRLSFEVVLVLQVWRQPISLVGAADQPGLLLDDFHLPLEWAALLGALAVMVVSQPLGLAVRAVRRDTQEGIRHLRCSMALRQYVRV